MARKYVRKSGLDTGRCPPTVVLNKDGKLCTGSGSCFRGLEAFPIDVVNYEVGSFDVVNNESELRAVIDRIARVLGKNFDADAAISDAKRPAARRVRSEYAEKWAAQALDIGFLTG